MRKYFICVIIDLFELWGLFVNRSIILSIIVCITGSFIAHESYASSKKESLKREILVKAVNESIRLHQEDGCEELVLKLKVIGADAEDTVQDQNMVSLCAEDFDLPSDYLSVVTMKVGSHYANAFLKHSDKNVNNFFILLFLYQYVVWKGEEFVPGHTNRTFKTCIRDLLRV
jgi:hypothetical protein